MPLSSLPAPSATSRPMRISVVIPHLNQPKMLARCLTSLAEGSRQADEIIVVDNGSDRPPEQICARFPGVRLMSESAPGPGPARNRGVADSTGDVLAFIDADCIADPGWLTMAERAMRDPDAQILGGDVRIGYVNPARITALEAYESIYAYRMDRYIARHGFTGTGNLVVRRGILEAVGPFGDLSVAEDRDWGQRATRAGYRIRYVPEMRVYHPARARFSDLQKKWDRHTAHDFTEAALKSGGRLRWGIKTLAMVASPLAELPRIAFSDRISGGRARFLAFACLLRIRLYRAWVMAHLLAGGDPDRLSGRWNRET